MSYTPPIHKKIFHSVRRLLAKQWLAGMSAIQIAITGSQGKTTTRTVLYHLLAKLGNTVVTDLNLDTTFNIPITALKVKPNTHYAIFECGIDHKGEMDRHLEIITPHIAIITGISPVHTDSEHLGSFESLIAEKQKLIEGLSSHDFAILNFDDEHVRKMASHTKAKIIFYGTDEKKCAVYVKNTTLTKDGLSFDLFFLGDSLHVNSHLIGLHHIYTFMTAFCVYQLIMKGKKMQEFPNLISDIVPLRGRMSIEKGPQGTTILNDTLRANPASTASGLKSFSEIPNTEGKKIAILGEMGELNDPNGEHKKIGKLLSTLSINNVVGIGPLQKILIDEAIKCGFPKENAYAVSSIHEAVTVLETFLNRGDFLYIKGSLMRHMERIIMLLNKEEVGCNVVVCPFYHQCSECKYKKTGYQNVRE